MLPGQPHTSQHVRVAGPRHERAFIDITLDIIAVDVSSPYKLRKNHELVDNLLLCARGLRLSSLRGEL